MALRGEDFSKLCKKIFLYVIALVCMLLFLVGVVMFTVFFVSPRPKFHYGVGALIITILLGLGVPFFYRKGIYLAKIRVF